MAVGETRSQSDHPSIFTAGLVDVLHLAAQCRLDPAIVAGLGRPARTTIVAGQDKAA